MFDFLRRSGPSAKQIERAVKRLTETHGEEAPRIEAAQRLSDWGTSEALAGLLKRFTMSSRMISQDMEEKRMVVELLVLHGESAVTPILNFMKQYHQVDWPVQALGRIVPEKVLVGHLMEIISTVADSEFAAPEHRVSLIRALQGHVVAEMVPQLEGFLSDGDDDVRIAAIETLSELEDGAREALIQAFLSAEERPRIRLRIAEIFAERRWAVTGYRPKMEERLPQGFGLNAKGVVQRR